MEKRMNHVIFGMSNLSIIIKLKRINTFNEHSQ